MIKTGIYKIISPTGKTYIGQSTNINKRWRTYEEYWTHLKQQPKLYNSLSKYGWNAHKKEIIEECLIEQLNEKEVYYKQQFIDCFGWSKALFCNIFDSGGGPLNEDIKQKISNSLIGNKNRLGKCHSQETKKIMSEISKGKSKSEKHKQKIKESKQNISASTRNKISKALKGKESPLKGRDRSYKGRVSPAKGTKWSKERREKFINSTIGKNKKGDSVINIITKQIWNSKSDCALFYKTSVTTINNWIKLNKNNLSIYLEI